LFPKPREIAAFYFLHYCDSPSRARCLYRQHAASGLSSARQALFADEETHMFDGLDVVHAHPARRWTAIASFTLQAALVAAALALPLLKPESLPDAFSRRQIFRPLSAGVERPRANQNTNTSSTDHAPVYPLLVRRGSAMPTMNAGAADPNAVGPPGINVIGVEDGIDNTLPNITGAPHCAPRTGAAHPPRPDVGHHGR
jgi:hypothetical protein